MVPPHDRDPCARSDCDQTSTVKSGELLQSGVKLGLSS